jgi:hypothetical protein
LQQHTIWPFIIMQQLHMPPASMLHKFCIMLQLIASSHEQVIFMPSLTFSILKVQRGTIIHGTGADAPAPGMVGVGIPMPAVLMPAIPIRSIIALLAIAKLPSQASPGLET